MVNKLYCIGLSFLCLFISLVCSITQSIHSPFQIIKYSTFAYGIILLIYTLVSFHKKRRSYPILLYFTTSLLTIFTLLLIDTYWLHALIWFPGNIRYLIFSTYGWIHMIVFICLGICLYYGIPNSTTQLGCED